MAARVVPLLDLDPDYLSTRQDRRDGWALGRLYDSVTGIFALRPRFPRTPLANPAGCELIHQSVVVRREAGDAAAGGRYNPLSLPDDPPPERVTTLDGLELALRWAAADPRQTGQTERPSPTFLGRFLRELGGG